MKDLLTITIGRNYAPEKAYICHVIFKEFLGVDYVIKFEDQIQKVYHISIGDERITFPDILFRTPSELWLKPASFPPQHPSYIKADSNGDHLLLPILYGIEDSEGPPQIDYFGSIFFLLTRYEEIAATQHDAFGRFRHEDSILFRYGCVRRPIVNEYLARLQIHLETLAPRIKFREHQYTLSLSHDVDVPLTFQMPLTDFIKKSAGDIYYRKSWDLLAKRVSGKVRYHILKDHRHDPNYNFNTMMEIEERAGVRGLFNFIPQPGQDPVDSKYKIESPAILALLGQLHDRNFEIGFHPTFQSFESFERTKADLTLLNNALTKIGLKPVTKGRHHYLRWSNPITWRIWDQLGLKEDGSVGYGLINGFRSGCCYKHTVFDLLERKHLQLVEEPLIVMDVNCDIDNSDTLILSETESLSQVCRKFNGNFTLLYHNNYIISNKQKRIFEEVINIAK